MRHYQNLHIESRKLALSNCTDGHNLWCLFVPPNANVTKLSSTKLQLEGGLEWEVKYYEY